MTYPVAAVSAPLHATAMKAHYDRMVTKNAARDRTHEMIHGVRRGHMKQLFPDNLDVTINVFGVPVANFIDVVAHDMAEGIAPLPSLACVSGKMQTDTDLKRAEIKNRIGDNYWRNSRLEVQMMQRGADWYVTYGFVAFFIEPCFEDPKNLLPQILVDDPRKGYYELDRYGRVRVYAKRWLKRIDDLCAQFPEYASYIRKNPNKQTAMGGSQDDSGDTELECVRWVDGTSVTLFLPQREGLILTSYQHRMSRPPVVIAERPSDDDIPRGQFDDVVGVQLARAVYQTLALEAAALAVQAPIAVPDDMDELPIGPHAILQSKNARDIHKVHLELPPTIFAEGAALDQELRLGARYPEARSGGVNASVITGKGVEALLGTFDSQIKGAQVILKTALEDVTAMCFEMDQKWWPNQVKTVSGTMSGASYEFQYSAAKDIGGRYACTVTYGFAAGLRDPSQAIVTMLQLEGAGMIAKGTTMQHMPMGIDPLQEQKKINVEASREALKQGFFALVQASGQLAAQGQDPAPIINLSVNVIRDLENGKPIEEAIAKAFAALEEQKEAQAQQEQSEMEAQGGAPGGPGQQFEGANGTPEAGVPGRQAPGQAGLPPGGRPTMAEMVSGFRGNGNLPVNQYTVRRSIPTGT